MPRLLGVRRACACGRLLCIQLGRVLHVKLGETWWVFDGPAHVTCGRCRRATTVGALQDAAGAAQ